MTKRRRTQVTCTCCAYPFPHRLSGGACTGDDWARYYWVWDRRECAQCNANTADTCEVADGRESINYCEGFRDLLHRGGHSGYPGDETR